MMQEKTDIPELLTVKEIQEKMRISKGKMY